MTKKKPAPAKAAKPAKVEKAEKAEKATKSAKHAEEEVAPVAAAASEEGGDGEEVDEDEASSGGSSGGGNAAALAAASGSGEMSASFKNFRHHPDMENFYRFIFENDLRHEALDILNQVMIEKNAEKNSKKTGAASNKR